MSKILSPKYYRNNNKKNIGYNFFRIYKRFFWSKFLHLGLESAPGLSIYQYYGCSDLHKLRVQLCPCT